jgi:hypothetical protein
MACVWRPCRSIYRDWNPHHAKSLENSRTSEEERQARWRSCPPRLPISVAVLLNLAEQRKGGKTFGVGMARIVKFATARVGGDGEVAGNLWRSSNLLFRIPRIVIEGRYCARARIELSADGQRMPARHRFGIRLSNFGFWI